MTVEPLVREATPADEEAIRQINMVAWAGGYCRAELLEERHGPIGGRPWAERIAESVMNYVRGDAVTTFVAERNGAVVGFAACHVADGYGNVGYNAVLPDHRGRGVGTALVERVVEFLRRQGAPVLVVSTLVSDAPVRHIYEGLGFQELSRSVYYTMDAP